ncbi:Xaa-Pro dipeptidyl-peptidase [Amycolatopsis sp. H20-H5]|uniref:Xaa-Pro dipeptidyl-peptidase n=1 Tax=Amycolatopsis sp. H20-H5 TaxID=3046309 RepID=UPI002DB8BA15|nr:Xaa-Pro dipeptidyl-peptidase [Amycolatopsis sp. H20-H5]MEC3982327.1 Xaa-Pro dipeptidyl-peptidase [Amycolatopsis sp. H20-H5]
MLAALGLAGVTLISMAVPASAVAEQARAVVIRDGETKPVYDFAKAVREQVFVETPVDSDRDGKKDRLSVYVTRPKETDGSLKVASIVEPSPYFGGTLDTEYHPAEVTDVPRLTPWDPPTGPQPPVSYGRVYYDNYFVSRGYAVLSASTLGTGDSEGCPTAIGTDEKIGMKTVVEWLTGKAKAFGADGKEIKASWSTGNVAMAGKSYDGTLPVAVASTGVPGLKTIVSISGIASWYSYYRANGAVVAPGGYVGEDADLHAKVVLTRKNPEKCAAPIHEMEQAMDRVSGDYNAFWNERNFAKDLGNYHGSVFQVAGINDWNVKPKNFSDLWTALGDHNIPRKLWLHQAGHDDPLYVAEQSWLDAVHKWFDHELYNVHNDVLRQPKVHFETAPGKWTDYRDWPEPGAHDVTLRLGANGSQAQPGTLGGWPSGFGRRQSFIDDPARTTDSLVAAQDKADPNRLLYVSDPLRRDVRVSGAPEISVRASVDGKSPYLSALLVDYGKDDRITGFGPTDKTWCFGDTAGTDSGCRPRYAYTTAPSDYAVISRGWLDVRNRHSASVTEPISPNQTYKFDWKLEPRQYQLKAGHRIAVILLVTDRDYTLHYPAGTKVSAVLGESTITIPFAP